MRLPTFYEQNLIPNWGIYWQSHGFHIEAEYLYKHYYDDAFKAVHAVDAFASYDIPQARRVLSATLLRLFATTT
ncbi:hypothetical protein [Prevotella sp.]|uniref:hypothetical protein n=1 Tax=Prevotella sp. TaxID=59823 RepID=UPI0027E33D2B|nr:hypothetical protein [Prevotella sp.]